MFATTFTQINLQTELPGFLMNLKRMGCKIQRIVLD